MSQVSTRPLYRGTADRSYRLSLGVVVMPDVRDDASWNTIVEMGIPHYNEWSQGIVSPGTRAFALSYKHMEHDFGKLSQEQAQELRRALEKLVGSGPNKAALWVDSMYMTREGLGFEDFSSRWVQNGLHPYRSLPVIRLTSRWNQVHPESGKRSAWLWLERKLGGHNKGVYTLGQRNKDVYGIGFERVSTNGLSIKDALTLWLETDAEKAYGFRPADEKDVRAEIAGESSPISARFRCPGRSSCIGYMLGRRNNSCGGTSDECIQLANSTNGTYFQDKLVLSTVGRIAHCVLTVIESKGGGSRPFLRREDLSNEELKEYTKVLISRKFPFRNIRLLNLNRF